MIMIMAYWKILERMQYMTYIFKQSQRIPITFYMLKSNLIKIIFWRNIVQTRNTRVKRLYFRLRIFL